MALKDEKVFVTSGKKKGQCSKGEQCMFRHESNDRARPTDVPPSNHKIQKHEVEVRRERELPEAEASLRNSIDRRVNTS